MIADKNKSAAGRLSVSLPVSWICKGEAERQREIDFAASDVSGLR